MDTLKNSECQFADEEQLKRVAAANGLIKSGTKTQVLQRILTGQEDQRKV